MDYTRIWGERLAHAGCQELKNAPEHGSRNVCTRISSGGKIESIAEHVPGSLVTPAFEKPDAVSAKAVMSIGAVKAVEIGDGTEVSRPWK